MANETPLQHGPIQFGLFDWIESDKLLARDTFEERLKMLEYADESGFFCYQLAEHHLTPLCLAPSPGIFLAAAAQRTRHIRLGPLVYLLPLYDPLRLLQEICMLDHLSNGRLDVGVGRGVVPFEIASYNVNPDETGDIFNEALDVLLKGFTNDVISHEGRYFTYENVRPWIRPLQQPYPPLWYASTNVESAPWVARNGFNTANIFNPSSDIRAYFDLYKRSWQEHQNDPGRLNPHVDVPKYGLVRHVYVAPTDRQAEEECRAAHEAWFHNISLLPTLTGEPRSMEFISNYDSLRGNEVMIAGSPESVTDQVRHGIEDTGCSYFGCIFAFGDLTHEQVMRSMRLFVQEVMPSI
ncbi:MAG: LLM class flavin-dependent oxidoreductase [Dehalococcoidia bacterium]|nr:LLM class flavin-dependent oxidoreductase [Dehalococcoidia bacterium]